MASVMSNRLFEQLNNLYEYDNPILAIISENIWRDFYYTKSKYIHKQYIGVLSTLTCKYPKLKIVYFDTDDSFIDYMVSLDKKLNEDGKKERPAPVMRKAKSIQMRKENALTAAEGVGIPMAKKLLKKYGSIIQIASAEDDDMLKIDKLGKKTVKNIKELLN